MRLLRVRVIGCRNRVFAAMLTEKPDFYALATIRSTRLTAGPGTECDILARTALGDEG